MNTPVSFEISKELKEKGFDGCCDKKYIAKCLWQKPNSREKYRNTEIHKNSSDVSAPTIAEVVMWLYEKHGIWIISSYELNIENHKKEWFWIAIKDGEEIAYQYRDFNLPTEAYEAAIEFTLKNLI